MDSAAKLGPHAIAPFKPLELTALAPLAPLKPSSLTTMKPPATPTTAPSPRLATRKRSPPAPASRPRNTARKSTYKKPDQNEAPPPITAPSVHLDPTPSLTREEREELLHHAQRFFPVNLRTKATEKSRNRFETTLRKNTEEEEFAPPIHVINDIDDDPCPELDFLFTNKVEFGQNVPTSSLEELSRCNCEGPCDPRSGTCLCAGIQEAYTEAGGFSYDASGKLKEFGVRTFECNKHCSCTSFCPNRVGVCGVARIERFNRPYFSDCTKRSNG